MSDPHITVARAVRAIQRGEALASVLRMHGAPLADLPSREQIAETLVILTTVARRGLVGLHHE